MNAKSNVFSLDAHRAQLTKTAQLAQTVAASLQESQQKLVALIAERSFSFRKPIVSAEEFDELIAMLKKQGIQDTSVALKDGTLITDSVQAVGQDTFMFSDEASAFLFDLLGAMYDYSVTDKGNPLIVAK